VVTAVLDCHGESEKRSPGDVRIIRRPLDAMIP